MRKEGRRDERNLRRNTMHSEQGRMLSQVKTKQLYARIFHVDFHVGGQVILSIMCRSLSLITCVEEAWSVWCVFFCLGDYVRDCTFPINAKRGLFIREHANKGDYRSALCE